MKEIVAYHCDFCKKYSKSKSVLKRHENNCYHNPITKACASCGNFYQEDKTKPCKFGIAHFMVPACKLGINIATLEDERVKLNLKHNCDNWKECCTKESEP